MEKTCSKPISMGTENGVKKRYDSQLILGRRETQDNKKGIEVVLNFL